MIDDIFASIGRYALIPFRRYRGSTGKPPAFLVGFAVWKSFMSSWLTDREVVHQNFNPSPFKFYTRWAPAILADRRSEVYVWGYKCPPFIERFCARFGVPLVRVEDGFLRSLALGATRVPPLSMCFDRSGVLYFDATSQSGLENLIETYDFAGNPDLMARARAGITRLIHSRLSKYNAGNDFDPEALYGPKTRKRILVVGQVEGDMSMIKGCDRQIDNNTFVTRVAMENPDAEIIYKPHPEVLAGIRKDPPQSDPWAVSGIARVLIEDVTLADAFETIDHVYTMTSLSGFEALIRGIPVTCYGMPFYAGWGATTDMMSCPRRTARRTPEELFAAAYILYPRYFNPMYGTEISFEEALDLLMWMRERRPAARPEALAPAVNPPVKQAAGSVTGQVTGQATGQVTGPQRVRA